MRIIDASLVSDAVEDLCVTANYNLNKDILDSLENCVKIEESEAGVHIIKKIIENANLAKEEKIAICQDTGIAVVFVEIGRDVYVTGKNLNDAIT